jgi:hypothetical protein
VEVEGGAIFQQRNARCRERRRGGGEREREKEEDMFLSKRERQGLTSVNEGGESGSRVCTAVSWWRRGKVSGCVAKKMKMKDGKSWQERERKRKHLRHSGT